METNTLQYFIQRLSHYTHTHARTHARTHAHTHTHTHTHTDTHTGMHAYNDLFGVQRGKAGSSGQIQLTLQKKSVGESREVDCSRVMVLKGTRPVDHRTWMSRWKTSKEPSIGRRAYLTRRNIQLEEIRGTSTAGNCPRSFMLDLIFFILLNEDVGPTSLWR